jgi:hypothetical protein
MLFEGNGITVKLYFPLIGCHGEGEGASRKHKIQQWVENDPGPGEFLGDFISVYEDVR